MPLISFWFLFLFFPIAVVFHLFAARLGESVRLFALIALSFLLFAFWDVRSAGLLAVSIVVNFAIARLLQQARDDEHVVQTNTFLFIGIGFNLALLGVFRYADFLIGSANSIFNADIRLARLFVPLGVLFFTCDQIAYLVDLKRGKVQQTDLIRYAAFVSFFPRLIAGPLLRYGRIEPQWEDTRVGSEDIATGLATIAIGLAKIVLLAGAVAPFVALTFSAAGSGENIDLFSAWTGILAFACQIYFDLSGYADIAIGIARCFGIRLPVNYRSPYRAENIAEFWRRWNITLSDFLRDYVYRPLGGEGHGIGTAIILLVTMVLGGLWYGAGWMFAAWALLHAFYLLLHRAWRALSRESDTLKRLQTSRGAQVAAIAATFLATTLAWSVFRAPDFATALNLLAALAGQHGAVLPADLASVMPSAGTFGIAFAAMDSAPILKAWSSIAAGLIVIFAFPDTATLLSSFSAHGPSGIAKLWPLRWRASPLWAIVVGAAVFAVLASPEQARAMLHWRF